ACTQDERCRAFSYTAGRCWLKNGVASPALSPSVTSAVRRGFEINSDRPGLDLRSFTISYRSPEKCQTECAKDSSCQSWTFQPSIANTDAVCRLKTGIPAQVSHEGMVSGVKGVEYF